MPVIADTDRIAAAQAYISALASHDADAVPFAPGCTRVEMGLKTGFSGNHLRRSLNRGLQYRVIESVSTPEFSVDGDADSICRPSRRSQAARSARTSTRRSSSPPTTRRGAHRSTTSTRPSDRF